MSDSNSPEFSERARYVTDQVSLWVCNDGDYYESARGLAQVSVTALQTYLLRILSNPLMGSAPWHVMQELAPNDFARIHWADIARDLIGD